MLAPELFIDAQAYVAALQHKNEKKEQQEVEDDE